MRIAGRVAVPGQKGYETAEGGRCGTDRLGLVDVAEHRSDLETNRDESPGRRRATRYGWGWFEWMVCSAGRAVNAGGVAASSTRRLWAARPAARHRCPERMQGVCRQPADRRVSAS